MKTNITSIPNDLKTKDVLLLQKDNAITKWP